VVDFSQPANRKLIAYLLAHSPPDRAAETNPRTIKDPYYSLGTHPEIVGRLWDELGAGLSRCQWILYGRPVLVHPDSGVVFGWAGGSLTYALRLPDTERHAALRAGAQTVHHYPAYPGLNIAASTLDLADFGPDWIFGGWYEGEELWCLAAFHHAGREEAI
jgi:hypothetical protein